MTIEDRVTAVFLTKTSNRVIHEMTSHAIETMRRGAGPDAERIDVVVVESDPLSVTHGFGYDNVTRLQPDEPFNYHRFMNLGITARPNAYYLLCNNDLEFADGWLHPLIEAVVSGQCGSASPLCPELDRLVAPPPYRESGPLSFGYDMRSHVSGWCIFASEATLRAIGLLDERFDFYFADNDYALCLRRAEIRHALVHTSRVTHLEHQKQTADFVTEISDADRQRLPRFARARRFAWLSSSRRMIDGFECFCGKWGDYRVLRLKQRLHDVVFVRYGLPGSGRLLFRPKSSPRPVAAAHTAVTASYPGAAPDRALVTGAGSRRSRRPHGLRRPDSRLPLQ